MQVKRNITLNPKNSKRHLTGVIKIVILKLKNITIHRRVLPVLSSKPFSKSQCQTGPTTLFHCNTHRRVLPALVLPHLRTAQLGVPLQGRHPSVVITATLSTVVTTSIAIALITSSVSALTYQDSVDVSFTFDPTLSISLSSNNISIDNLVPGNYAHSNTITINVSTNNVYGYILTAKVGEDEGGAGISAGSDLVNASSDTPFTSLSPNDRLTLPNFTNNTWGYTTSTNINNATTAYTGLLYNTDTTINMTTNNYNKPIGGYPGTSTTNFTIGANASTEQLSGNYTNTISFTAVTNIVNTFTIDKLKYMQDFANLTVDEKAEVLDSMTEDAQYQLIDSRDNNTYFISKLCMEKTGSNCTSYDVWMTQNLDLCIGCSGTATLTSENTDLNQYDTNGDGSGNRFGGYTYSNGSIVWNPTASTLTGSPASISGNDVVGWSNNPNIPYMAESDNAYSYQGTRYDSLSNCIAANHTEAQCAHYHVGNYYNFPAVVAMNNISSYTTNYTVMPNSICPKGWRLPVGLVRDDDGNISPTDFNRIFIAYNKTSNMDLVGSANTGWAGNSLTGIGQSPLYFVRSGGVSSTSVDDFGKDGRYWTSTIRNDTYAYGLSSYSSAIKPANASYRRLGRSVRCMLR